MEELVTTVVSAGPLGASARRHFVPTYYVSCGDRIEFRLPVRSGARYQWRLNERSIAGAHSEALVLTNVGTMAAGNYSVLMAEEGTEAVWNVAILAVVTEARLTRFYLQRASAAADPNLVAGFFVSGAGTKHVAVRSDAADDHDRPEITLAAWDGQALATTRGLSLSATLESGSYSAIVTPAVQERTLARLEVVEDQEGDSAACFSNFSGRVMVDAETPGLVLGFSIVGTTSVTVLVRGIGPSLASLFSLAGALPRTQIFVRDATGRILESNRHWQGAPALASAFEQAGAFALLPSSGDSALVMTLPPGDYEAELLGIDGEQGIGLIELYDLQSR